MAREQRIASWLPSDDRLGPFFDGVRRFVASELVLPEGTDPEQIGPKLIVDPLIGYIHLRSWEAALLDTHLFQRLRRIKQVGLAYLVFPTLSYSRFEHTLGVLGRLNQILVKLQENARRVESGHHLADLVERYETAARLAAMCHDCGHCIFSHVSESIIENLPGNGKYPSAEEIRRAFSEHFDTPKSVPFSEIFSVAFLGMPEMVSFLEQLEIPGKRSKIASYLEHAARFILGLPILNDPESCFVAQVMNSGLDVDKLDYMTREAHFSGISLEIDLARILDKLRVFQLNASQVPKGLLHHKRMLSSNTRAAYNILGLARGGQFAYEEFCVARVALYEKIYLHQKVRAAEAQLSAQLSRITDVATEFGEAHRWLWLKESYQEHEGAPLPTLDILELFAQNAPNFTRLGLGAIEQRSLLNRAFAFGPANCLTDPVEAISSQPMGTQRPMTSYALMQLLAQETETFADLIRENVVEIASAIEMEEDLPKEWKESIVIDLPKYYPVQQDHDTIYFERPTRIPHKWAMPIDRIVDYYQRNRALGYVFAPRKLCPVVLVAAEKAMWDISGAVFEQESVVSLSVVKAASAIKATLDKIEFYAETRALRPISTYLQTIEAQEDIQQVVHNLRSFESFHGERVTVSALETFVSQFPNDLQEACVKWLQLLRVVGPEVLVQSVGEMLDDLIEKHGSNVAVVPLGRLSDSASRMAYTLRGQKTPTGRVIPEASRLDDELICKITSIVLFDDNVNTGRQALNIMAEWLGIRLPKKVFLKEKHVRPLGDKAVDRLLNMPVGFAFSVGAEYAAVRLVELLEKYCKMHGDNLSVSVGQELFRNRRPFSGSEPGWHHDRSGDLKEFLARWGKNLLEAEGSSQERAVAYALGYGGVEAMIAFPYNVPTMTVVPLWNKGIVDGQEWIPLIERRRRTVVRGQQTDEKT